MSARHQLGRWLAIAGAAAVAFIVARLARREPMPWSVEPAGEGQPAGTGEQRDIAPARTDPPKTEAG